MPMYGDLMSALTFSVALPLFIDKAVRGNRVVTPILVCTALAVTVPCLYSSWWYQRASWLGYASMTLFSVAVCYGEWPNPDSKALVYHYLWHLVMTCANTSLPLASKAVLGLVAVTWASAVCLVSPHYTLQGTGPILSGAAALFFVINLGVHWCCYGKIDLFQAPPPMQRNITWNWKTIRQHANTLLVLSVFIYVMVVEVSGIVWRDGYAVDGVHNLCTAALFGTLGLVAAGTLRGEADTKELKERADLFARSSEAFQLATMALNASHTAIAIADHHRRIMLFNPAFQRLAGQVCERHVLGYVLEDVLRLSGSDASVLVSCFQEVGGQAEFYLRGRVVRVTVAPSSDAESESVPSVGAPPGGFVLILKDVTEERALERAIESAQQQASMTQAIMNAIAAMAQRMQPQPVPLGHVAPHLILDDE